jgi:hypothetical protein
MYMNTPQKSLVVILYIIITLIFVYTYYYLEQLNSCECFVKNDKYSVNIEFMKFFQVLEIFLFTIYVGMMLFFNSKIVKKKMNKPMPLLLSTISLALLIGINVYMTYNVFNLYNNIKEDCSCSGGFLKYFVYYEGIVSGINVLRFVEIFGVIVLVFLFNMLK